MRLHILSLFCGYRDVQVGTLKERRCASCHLSMSVSYSAVQFVPRQNAEKHTESERAAETARASSTRQDSKNTSQGQLVAGTPLPAKGTCKHYPHSYRPAIVFLQLWSDTDVLKVL